MINTLLPNAGSRNSRIVNMQEILETSLNVLTSPCRKMAKNADKSETRLVGKSILNTVMTQGIGTITYRIHDKKRRKLAQTEQTDGWLNDRRFYVLFKSSSVMVGRWADDNERLYAMESHVWLRRFASSGDGTW